MPMPLRDLSGQRFGRLVAIRRVENSPHGAVRWFCKCDCGVSKPILGYTMTHGQSRSCGCVRSGPTALQEKFDRSFVPQERAALSVRFINEYRSWNSMQERCNNPKATKYNLYGGRGIRVCKRWGKFETFLEDMGERPKGTTLDRKNSNLWYRPSNCRWATQEQQHDGRRCTIFVTDENGKKVTLRAFAQRNGIARHKLMYHAKRGHNLNDCVRSMKTNGIARCDKRYVV